MPMYDYKCKDEKCGTATTAIRTYDTYKDCPECPKCGGETEKYITATFKTTVKGVSKGNYNSGDYS